jgi:mono/diheme cytochrome c family protein/ABC-type branched-subunit amino acid transport system substrate-binding protein
MFTKSGWVAYCTQAAVAGVLAAVSPAADCRTDDRNAEVGRQLYQLGVLPSGGVLRGQVQGDVAAAGPQLVCAGCHGRSGMGVGEGQTVMPAVAGPLLYQAREIRRPQVRDTRPLRPAYTDEALARAIRTGVDPGGRTLDAMMPRYTMDDADMSHLISYLKSLSSNLSPGVDADDIHFATIITDGVDPRRRRAVLDVLEAFVASKSAETRQEARRAGRSPAPMQWHYQAYRKWNLHVWDLSGPAETWRAQLDQLYERQPVFAVIGGMGGEIWSPVHEFCEQRELPCLLPNTDLPIVSDTDYYSVYFSKGMALEAQVLAKHLSEERPAPLVQVYRKRGRGSAAASEFRRAMKQHGMTDVEERTIDDADGITPAFWQSLQLKGPSPRFVLWLDDKDLADIQRRGAVARGADRVYVSSTLAGDAFVSVATKLGGEVYAVHLRELPAESARRLSVLDVWMRAKGIPVSDAPLQANTLFAATLAAQALKHIGSNFYRDYFIERIEHIFDSMVTPSAYPRLGLGPNQRYASKGGYILRVSGGSIGELTQRGEWIVP